MYIEIHLVALNIYTQKNVIPHKKNHKQIERMIVFIKISMVLKRTNQNMIKKHCKILL